jgi:putative tryptophan/tyrosine transport system substrate-binding protein
MRRRDFITLLGGAAAAWPLAARAQQAMIPVVGFLGTASAAADAFRVVAFRRGLEEAGYVEGRNVAIEYRHAENHYDRLPEMAADLVRRQVSVIAAAGGPAAPAAKAATQTIPIVFVIGVDPVEAGLVANLNRPGGNLTGMTTLEGELEPKRLELLHELIPNATAFAVLINPTNPRAEANKRHDEAAARTLGLEIQVLHASNDQDLDAAFATLSKLQASALMISTDPFFNSRTELFAALAARHSMPTIFQFREFVAAGGLMSYGAGSLAEVYRLAGLYAGRILKGEKPGDLPVQETTKVDLFINLKTAKVLGLTVPLPLLSRADEVIE